MSGRLAGRRPMITRSSEDAGDWARQLGAAGAEAVVLPCIATETIADPTLGARLQAAVSGADWLIFTSRRGVEATADLLGYCELPSKLQIANVGAATAARVAERLGKVAHVGQGNAELLARELVDEGMLGQGSRCVLALAANAPDTLERILREAGAEVERYDVYRTIPVLLSEPKQPLSAFGCDSVIFASPSAVTGFDNQVNVDTDVQMVTIGPTTSAAVRKHGWEVAAEAREPDLTGIIEAMLEMKGV